MEFIEGLPSSHQKNIVVVVINRLTKYGYFIPIRHTFIERDLQATWDACHYSR